MFDAIKVRWGFVKRLVWKQVNGYLQIKSPASPKAYSFSQPNIYNNSTILAMCIEFNETEDDWNIQSEPPRPSYGHHKNRGGLIMEQIFKKRKIWKIMEITGMFLNFLKVSYYPIRNNGTSIILNKKKKYIFIPAARSKTFFYAYESYSCRNTHVLTSEAHTTTPLYSIKPAQPQASPLTLVSRREMRKWSGSKKRCGVSPFNVW